MSFYRNYKLQNIDGPVDYEFHIKKVATAINKYGKGYLRATIVGDRLAVAGEEYDYGFNIEIELDEEQNGINVYIGGNTKNTLTDIKKGIINNIAGAMGINPHSGEFNVLMKRTLMKFKTMCEMDEAKQFLKSKGYMLEGSREDDEWDYQLEQEYENKSEYVDAIQASHDEDSNSYVNKYDIRVTISEDDEGVFISIGDIEGDALTEAIFGFDGKFSRWNVFDKAFTPHEDEAELARRLERFLSEIEEPEDVAYICKDIADYVYSLQEKKYGSTISEAIEPVGNKYSQFTSKKNIVRPKDNEDFADFINDSHCGFIVIGQASRAKSFLAEFDAIEGAYGYVGIANPEEGVKVGPFGYKTDVKVEPRKDGLAVLGSGKIVGVGSADDGHDYDYTFRAINKNKSFAVFVKASFKRAYRAFVEGNDEDAKKYILNVSRAIVEFVEDINSEGE